MTTTDRTIGIPQSSTQMNRWSVLLHPGAPLWTRERCRFKRGQGYQVVPTRKWDTNKHRMALRDYQHHWLRFNTLNELPHLLSFVSFLLIVSWMDLNRYPEPASVQKHMTTHHHIPPTSRAQMDTGLVTGLSATWTADMKCHHTLLQHHTLESIYICSKVLAP